MTYITTFQFDKPERIDVEYFAKMSDQRDSVPAAKKAQITDANTITTIMGYAGKLPDKGDIMIKMGDVPITNIILSYPDKKLYFTFYNHRVKTPATSFYSNAPADEKALYDFLFSIVNK